MFPTTEVSTSTTVSGIKMQFSPLSVKILGLINGWKHAMLKIPNTRVCVLPACWRVVGSMLGCARHWWHGRACEAYPRLCPTPRQWPSFTHKTPPTATSSRLAPFIRLTANLETYYLDAAAWNVDTFLNFFSLKSLSSLYFPLDLLLQLLVKEIQIGGWPASDLAQMPHRCQDWSQDPSDANRASIVPSSTLPWCLTPPISLQCTAVECTAMPVHWFTAKQWGIIVVLLQCTVSSGSALQLLGVLCTLSVPSPWGGFRGGPLPRRCRKLPAQGLQSKHIKSTGNPTKKFRCASMSRRVFCHSLTEKCCFKPAHLSGLFGLTVISSNLTSGLSSDPIGDPRSTSRSEIRSDSRSDIQISNLSNVSDIWQIFPIAHLLPDFQACFCWFWLCYSCVLCE